MNQIKAVPIIVAGTPKADVLRTHSPIHHPPPHVRAAVLLILVTVGAAAWVRATSTIQFPTNGFAVFESAATVSLTVQRLDDMNSFVSVDYTTVDWTAKAGLDYTATNGTLTFVAGETNRQITVSILNDGLVDPDESFSVTLSNPTNAVLGAPATNMVFITDNDTGLQFEFSGYTVMEGDDVVLIGVARGDDGDFSVSLDCATSDLTAKSGLDYTGVTNTLFFGTGEKVRTFTVPMLNDGLKEANETFRVTLRNPTNQVLGSLNVATVTIVDNDLGVQFGATNYWAPETDGTLAVQVLRGNDRELGPFTVDLATSDLTATAGADYRGTNMTLAFAQGETARLITVPILYDEQAEADEKFKLTLSNPTNAVLGPCTTATNTILDTTGQQPHRFDGIGVQPDRSVQLTLGGSAAHRFTDYFDLYPLAVSSNLANWTSLATLFRTNSSPHTLVFADTNAAPFSRRFYGTCSNQFLTAFPKPAGPYAVGTFSRVLTDPTRRNRYSLSTNSSFMCTVWYPAPAPGAGSFPGPYADEAVARDQAFYAYWGWSPEWPGVMPLFVAHSIPDRPAASGTNRFPVILYSHGRTCGRTSGSQSAAELASYGYIVAAVDHEDAHATVFPDARGVRYGLLDPATVAEYVALARSRTSDMQCLLGVLNEMDGTDPVLAHRLDLDRIGTMGFSFGGATAAEIASLDDRVKCAALLDGWIHPLLYPQLTSEGLHKPFLAMNRAIIDDGHGMEDFANYSQNLFDLASTNATWLKIANTGHFAFSDFAWFVELTPDSRQGAVAINACLLWFFDTYLKGEAPSCPSNPEITDRHWK